MDKIRFGVIGCGYIARKAFIPALKKSKYAELVAVASRDKNKAEFFAAEFECDAKRNYESLLSRNDISAVYIATVPSTHEEIILSAAKHGKHILCEKPLTVSYNSAIRIVDYCKKKKIGIFEGFMYQFHSQHQKVRDIVNDGEIGKPILFQAQFGFPPLDKDNYRYRRGLGGGALLDAGSYTIHAARHFFQREPTEVYSVVDCNGREVDTHGSILLNFGNKQTAILSFGFNNYYRNSYSIWGTKGQVTVNRAFSVPDTHKPKIILEKQDYYKEIECESDDHFMKEIEYFCKGVSEEKAIDAWRKEALLQATVLNTVIEQSLMKY